MMSQNNYPESLFRPNNPNVTPFEKGGASSGKSSIQSLSASLMEYLSKVVSFDSLIILGCQSGSLPVCLFSTQETQHNPSMQSLVASSYVYDPFYSAFSERKLEGIYSVEDVITNRAELNDYRQRFQINMGRRDELAINIPLDKSRQAIIFIRRNGVSKLFSLEEKRHLYRHFTHTKKLCHDLWPRVWTASAGADNNLEQVMHQALVNFGADILTGREQEITALIIQGSDNKAIANVLEISVATVKVHRKSIYNKFAVSSLGELFQAYLSHLVQFSSQATFFQSHAA
ncbi:helix-turn-helix transcriptional regulator [Vibrio sp. JC009]|uniref:helix-turn-helix transcriptional regulator n=1 Tax=Vibrio sp. JC009 TaxID=2912314 RepID=UPI0023B109C1|nr:helix-turn-helix transcriptional regulator [Vibrio sp. JC009]WED23995.1 helix-turn-helix transcriptional regulator [Vibrio sp. JC009]